jgi:cysteine synthase
MSNYSSTLDVIGNTPVVRLRSVVPANAATVLVKLEYLNPTGSYKDRMARAIIEGAEQRGELRPGVPVVEYTGGSTGSSLAFVCAVKGYRLLIVTSDAFALEKRKTIAAFGGELIIVPSDGGMITADLIPRMMDRARQIADEHGAYATDQFNNRDALAGYHEIVRELLEQVAEPIDEFCGGIGTGGMLIGVSEALRKAGQSTRIVGLEPAGSPVLTTGRKGQHHIEGTGVGFVPPMLADANFDCYLAIDEDEARTMSRRLAREEGIFAGTSTGMNVVGAITLAEELGPGKTVVTVAVDSGLKYLAGDLYEAES